MYHTWRQTVYITLAGKRMERDHVGDLSVEGKIVIHRGNVYGKDNV